MVSDKFLRHDLGDTFCCAVAVKGTIALHFKKVFGEFAEHNFVQELRQNCGVGDRVTDELAL